MRLYVVMTTAYTASPEAAAAEHCSKLHGVFTCYADADASLKRLVKAAAMHRGEQYSCSKVDNVVSAERIVCEIKVTDCNKSYNNVGNGCDEKERGVEVLKSEVISI